MDCSAISARRAMVRRRFNEHCNIIMCNGVSSSLRGSPLWHLYMLYNIFIQGLPLMSSQHEPIIRIGHTTLPAATMLTVSGSFHVVGSPTGDTNLKLVK